MRMLRAITLVVMLASLALLSAGMNSGTVDETKKDESKKPDESAAEIKGSESAVNLVRVQGPEPIYALPGIDMFKMGVDAVTGKFAEHSLFQYYYPVPHIWGYTEEQNEKNLERHAIHENIEDTYMLPEGFSASTERTCSFESKVTMYHYSTEYENALAASAKLDGLLGALSMDASVQRVQKVMSSHEKSLSKVAAPCVVWQVSHFQGFRMSRQFLDLLERGGLVAKIPAPKVGLKEEKDEISDDMELLEEEEESEGSGQFVDDLMSELSEVAAAVVSKTSTGIKGKVDGEVEPAGSDPKSGGTEPEPASSDPKSGGTEPEAAGSDSTGNPHSDPAPASGTPVPKVEIVNYAEVCLARKVTSRGILLEDGSDQDPECNTFVKRCATHKFTSVANKAMCREYVINVEKKYIQPMAQKVTGTPSSVQACVDDCVRGPEFFFEDMFNLFGTHFVSKSGLGGTVEMSKEVSRKSFYERSTKAIGAELRGEFTLLMGQPATEEGGDSGVMYQVQATMPDGTVKTYELKDHGDDTKGEAAKEAVEEKKLTGSLGGSASTSEKGSTHESDMVTIEVHGGVPGSLSSDGKGWGEWAATVEKAPVMIEPLYHPLCQLLSTIPRYTYYNDDPQASCTVNAAGKVECAEGDPGTELQTYRYAWTDAQNAESHALHLKRACKYRMREYVSERGHKSASVYELYLVFGFPDEKYKDEYYNGADIYITIVGEHGILRDVPLTNYKRDKSFAFMPGRGNHYYIDNYASIGDIKEIFLMLEVPGIQGEEPFEPEKPSGRADSDLTKMKPGVRLVYDEARIIDVSTGQVYFFFGSAHASQRLLRSKMAGNFDATDPKKSHDHMRDIGIRSNATIADAPFPIGDLAKFTPAIPEPEADSKMRSEQDFYEIIVKVHDDPGSGSMSQSINLIIQGDDLSFTVQLPLQSMRVYIAEADEDSAEKVPILRQCFEPGSEGSKSETATKVSRKDVSKGGKDGEGMEHHAKGYYDEMFKQMAHKKDKKSPEYQAMYSQVMGCSNHGLAGNVGIYRYKNLPVGRLYQVEVDNPGRSSIRIEHIDIIHVSSSTFVTTAYRARFSKKRIGAGEAGDAEDDTKHTQRLASRLSEIGKPVIEESRTEGQGKQHAMSLSG